MREPLPPFFDQASADAVRAGVVRGEGAMALLSVPDGRILLHLRDDHPGIWYPGHWALFGGAVESAEDVALAVHREIREELGLELTAPTPLWRVFDADASRQLVTIFHAELPLALSPITLGEGQEARWFTPADTESLRITPFLHRALREFLRTRAEHVPSRATRR